MAKLNCAVIGVGYLGRFHAQKYQMLAKANLVGVCDFALDTAQRVAQELQVTAFHNYQDLYGKVDAVSIAATTKAHFQIAKDCLEHGIHVLLEKPMTETLQQAEELIAIARAQQLKFQIGHLERFNPAYIAVAAHLTQPRYIDAQRLAPFKPRGADVNVVLDLMIHDIDLIQTMVNSPIQSITAHGSSLLTPTIDTANARIAFQNGCVANLVSSRLSFVTERKMRVFQPQSYLDIDYQLKKVMLFRQDESAGFPGIPEEIVVDTGDALQDEIDSFLTAITADTPPIITGEHGRDALATAIKISTLIEQSLAHHAPSA